MVTLLRRATRRRGEAEWRPKSSRAAMGGQLSLRHLSLPDVEASGARGTPTFCVNGRRHTWPYDAATLADELRETRTAPAGGRS